MTSIDVSSSANVPGSDGSARTVRIDLARFDARTTDRLGRRLGRQIASTDLADVVLVRVRPAHARVHVRLGDGGDTNGQMGLIADVGFDRGRTAGEGLVKP